MRILQIITLCELGGAQSVVANIANALCDGNEVFVASGEGDGKMWKMLDKRITRVHLKHLKRELSLWDDLRTVFDMWRLYRKYKPDVIHLHSSKAGFLGRLAFPAKRVVYTVHGFDSVRVANRKFLFLEKMMQWRCKSIVAVSKYDEYYLNLEKITRNVRTIYNGTFTPSVCKDLLFTVPLKYKKTILCVARLSPQKNVRLFMDVAALLPDYAFVWIGNLEPVKGAPDNAFFLGNIPNAAMYSSIADLFILTSNYEGLPIVIIEAMSLGRPVVASNVGGVNEIVRDEVNGYALENNAELFAEKISYILENPKVYDQMCRNSREIYEKDFTVENMVGEYKKVYNSVLGKDCF